MALGMDSPPDFTFKAIIISLTIVLLLPVSVNIFVEKEVSGQTIYDLTDDLLQGYRDFTGSANTNVHEELWVMNGIYTPYGVGVDSSGNEYQTTDYFYTPDNWIHSGKVTTYSPAQYRNTASEYTVVYDDTYKCYRYNTNGGTTQDGYKDGDLYTSVTMDIDHQSDVFFTPSGKHTSGDKFWYDYTGYMYSFTPSGDYYTVDNNGNPKQVIATSTSLNLIWFNYYGQSSGISGELVLSGSDSGLGYISSQDIVNAFNSVNSISRFEMVFNGVVCWVYVKLNPFVISQGMSVEDAYNSGNWSVMITSKSTEISTYTSTEYNFNIYEIWDTFYNLFTFNMDGYNMSPMMKTVASLTINVCLYAFLLSIGLYCWPVLLFAGVVACIQAFVVNGIDFPDIDWWPFD